METWRPVRGFEGYEVSNEGRVRNEKFGNILTPYIDARGIVQVTLRKDGKTHIKRARRLVAEAFLPLPDDYEDLDVIQIDGDTLNCRPENLEWGSRKDVVEQAYRRGCYDATKTSVRVVETGEVFDSIKSCADAFGYTSATISRALDSPCYRIRGCDYHFERV